MVTELDKLKKAKEYIEKLADGIDPFTGEELAHDTALNNVRLSRCFFYVADVLEQVIGNGGVISRSKGGQKKFFITDEELERVKIPEETVPVSIFVKAVNDAVNDVGRKKLAATTVANWLVDEGFLDSYEYEPGKHRKKLNDKSAALGISSEVRVGAQGSYEIMLYNPKAQRFLLDNLKNILNAKE